MKSNQSGSIAEFFARIFFIVKGYAVIAKNYKTGRGTGAGEIDFIAKRGKTIVFVEVKKRKSLDEAAYSISEKQKERIINGAKSFLKSKKAYENYDIRFDVILVKFPFSIRHIKNAWISSF